MRGNNMKIVVYEPKREEEEVKGCKLMRGCQYATAVCRVEEPDDGCYVYRYIKSIIDKENMEIINKLAEIPLINPVPIEDLNLLKEE